MNRITIFMLVVIIVTVFSCTQPNESKEALNIYDSQLFQDVQLAAVFPDSKTFADCTPKSSWGYVIEQYNKQRSSPSFDIHEFVHSNFDLPRRPTVNELDTTLSLNDHLNQLWTVLQRQPDVYDPKSSLIPLPNSYIVPGGRFSEIYYWDSYFTMLGLLAQNHDDIVKNMINNFAFLIDSVGFIPNGNRAYYLGRSQPPFFAAMVELLEPYDSLAALHYLPSMQKEYDFWMEGLESITEENRVINHVVMLPDGSILNRYFDKIPKPRPEAYKEDYRLAEGTDNPELLYTDLRAAAESGWDFCSRWFKDGKTLKSIQTTSYVTPDHNSLLYHLEMMLAKGYKQQGNLARSAEFVKKATDRKTAMLKYCYAQEDGFFYDFNFRENKQSESRHLGAMYPLFFKMVEPGVAASVSKIINAQFLKPGGVTTTLVETGEQWDAPNGWAPLQWMTYQGLRNYELNALAFDIKSRWMHVNKKVFNHTHKMMEKYNVMDTTLLAGGGEYPNQDGFGWTNGVYLAMLRDSVYNH